MTHGSHRRKRDKNANGRNRRLKAGRQQRSLQGEESGYMQPRTRAKGLRDAQPTSYLRADDEQAEGGDPS